MTEQTTDWAGTPCTGRDEWDISLGRIDHVPVLYGRRRWPWFWRRDRWLICVHCQQWLQELP